MSNTSALRAGDRVLVTRLNYLGDVVLSLPLVDAIRREHAGVEIDYLARDPGAALLRGDPRFARVIAWPDGAGAALATMKSVRGRGYRAVIDLYSNPRSAWVSWVSGATIRIGGDRRGRRHLYTHPIATPRGLPVTEVFMHYGEPLGVRGPATKPSLTLTAAEGAEAEARLERAGAPAARAPRIGIHPGGKWTVKRWPAPQFAELVTRVDALGARAVLFTGPDEAEATRAVERAARAAGVVLDAMPIRAVAAVISRLDAMVACDGGIMHTSAALGTPTVGIFGSSEPAVWFPYEAFGPYRAAAIDVPCRPCHQHVCPLGHTRCLNELTPAHVASLVEKVLSDSQRRIP